MVASVLKSPFLVLLAAVFLTGGPWKPFLAAAILHELGHCLGALAAGIPLRRLGAGAAGLHLDFAMETVSYRRELVILLSGSLFGLFTLLWIRNPAYRACALCLNLANLLPAAGLDGGGILACLLHQRLDGDSADRICRGVSLAMAVMLWLAGMWIVLRVGPNPTWMLCGMAAVFWQIRK
ncbi:MAG: hypothetical protein IJ480_04775 [Clostridia bacterium]|nr:hypothetical protein [Clostridia bacterium]